MQHALGIAGLPAGIQGFRLYESGIDEDQLGTFRLVAGNEPAATAWYATFWRRYWYESFTGAPSKVPAPVGPPPDAEQVHALIDSMLPALDVVCQRADEIVRVTAGLPVDSRTLQCLQREQTLDRERVARRGLATLATLPLTTACLRLIQNDNVQGLTPLARHHAGAYRAWRTELAVLRRSLGDLEKPGVSKRVPMLADPVPASIR
jgi:hypothetical protein